MVKVSCEVSMKPQFRVLGVDDGPFSFTDRSVPVIGVVYRKGYIDAILRSELAVDGDDATEVIAKMVTDSGPAKQLAAVMLDGITFGGFNVVDLGALNEDTGVPVITVTRDKPDMDRIRRALEKMGASPAKGRKVVPDWKERYARLEKLSLAEVSTGHNPVHIAFKGLPLSEAKGIVHATTVRGAMPEPLRLAHLIATALVKGKSHGNP